MLYDAITPAVGEITHLGGRVLTASGQPLRNASSRSGRSTARGRTSRGGRQASGHDRNFQGYGRFLTDAKGQYYFRTIKPIEYTLAGMFRTTHIHLAISRNGTRLFTTQILVKGHPANARDGIARRMDAAALDTLLADFTPVPGSRLRELNASFDVVLGRTAHEGEDGVLRGVGASDRQRRRG